MKNKEYEIRVGWKLSQWSSTSYEETYAVEARSREAAFLTGFAMAREIPGARDLFDVEVTIEKRKEEVTA